MIGDLFLSLLLSLYCIFGMATARRYRKGLPHLPTEHHYNCARNRFGSSSEDCTCGVRRQPYRDRAKIAVVFATWPVTTFYVLVYADSLLPRRQRGLSDAEAAEIERRYLDGEGS